MTQQQNKDESVRQSDGSISNIAKVDVSERTLSIVALVFSVAAFMLGIWAITETSKASRESRLLQQQVMDQSALLLREGLTQPGDALKGPAGNLSYKREK